jgi:hypothetical protein
MVLTMVYNTQNFWVFGLFPSSGSLENTTFRKLDLLPSSGGGGRAQLSRWLLPYLPLRTETEPLSETSCSLQYQTMEKVQQPSNSVWTYSGIKRDSVKVLKTMFLEYRGQLWGSTVKLFITVGPYGRRDVTSELLLPSLRIHYLTKFETAARAESAIGKMVY